ncbi:MAG TPA: anaerobic ribonucleoside-triphosphate reductase activating protein [bacterium]|nr:anaerobic ribonucleoside-triphosphate reductase activating protein [bacterium]
MLIGGLQKFSLLDYPGHVTAIVFTQGCNFRCQFCYNPMLVWPSEVGKLKNSFSSKNEGIKKGHPLIKEGDLFDFLKSRMGKLDGVVVSGGEPTIQRDLPEFLAKIKELGFKIKLDTNGTSPNMLKKVLAKKLVDYIAMDIKAPAEKYEKVTGVKSNFSKIKESIKIIRESGLPYEFRSTTVPGLHSAEDIRKMGELIRGADKWFLQILKSNTDLINIELEKVKPYTKKEMEEFKKIGLKLVKECRVR